MANERYTEPIVGREKIRRKMEELKLNDCRAKIKQIDCLETLVGGLVIQVIGELSNNGRPMRRFLQTFVLAPSPEEGRTEGDQQGGPRAGTTDRRGVNLGDTSTSSSQKFFVLNSIFRYQDDGQENEFENDIASVHASVPSEVDSGEKVPKELTQKPTYDEVHADRSQGLVQAHVQNVRGLSESTKDVTATTVERVARDFDRDVKISRPQAEQELKQHLPDGGTTKAVANGTTKTSDKKSETSEKPTENGSIADSNNSNPSASSVAATVAMPARTQPSNEPKTWANMVRNHPAPSAIQQANPNKPLVGEHPQIPNQLSSQAHQQQPPQLSSQNNNSSGNISTNNNNNNNNNLGNNRRRHMMRKPANKPPGGRSIKRENRPPRPPMQQQQQQPPSQQGKPAA